MSRNILNENAEVNVYLNRDPIQATLPVQALQPTEQDPITISLKGLSGFTGQAGKAIKVNSSENALEYADDDDTNFWDLSSNNLRPKSTANRLIIGDTSSFASDYGFTLKGSSNHFYTNGRLDINNTGGNNIYLGCDSGNSNDIYFGTQNSQNQGTSNGVLLRGVNTSSTQNSFKINSVANGLNTNRVEVDMDSDDTTLRVTAAGDAYLELKSNDTNYLHLRYDTSVGTGVVKMVYYHSAGNQSIWNYDDANTQYIVYPRLRLDDTIMLNSAGNELTLPTMAGKFALESQIPTIPTQYWGFSSANTGVVYPTSTAYSVLIGTSTPSNVSYSLETTKSILCGDKMDILDDLTVSNIWRVEYNSPYTYIYDPTNYSSSNPYNQYHTNGTFYLSNLPVGGSGSNFRWTVSNTTQLMNLNANGLLTLFGTDAAEIQIKNDGDINDVSRLSFTNDDTADLYKFEFMKSANTFTLFNNSNSVFNHDGVNDIFTVEADLIVKNNTFNTSKIDIDSVNATGAKSILEFSTAGTAKFQYIYDLNTGTLSLINAAGTTITQINSQNEFSSLMKTTLLNQLVLTGSGPQISNGTYSYTLPSSSGTLLTNNDVTGEWEEFNSVTLKPENTSIEAILVKNGIEFYDSYTNPTEGYQILVNHTDNTFKITNLANNKNIFTFDNDTDIVSSTMKHSFSNQLVLTGSSPQISDGVRTFTLPSTSGTLLTNNDIGTGEWTTFDTNTLKPVDSAVHSLMIKNAVEFYNDYTTPTAGFQILVNHTNTSFKITNKAETGDIISFTTTDDIINVGSLVDIRTNVDYTTNSVNAMVVDGDCVFTTSSGKNDPVKIAMNNSSFNYQGVAFYNTKANAEAASGTGRLAYLESHRTTGELNLRASASNIIESNGGSYNITLSSSGFTGTHATYNSSDDRIKFDEELITNATDSIMKLRPQIYNKQFEMGTEDKRDREYNLERIKEAGLIAQEVYYEAPEFRHLVVSNSDDIIELDEDVDFEDIQNDINYEDFGWNPKVKAGIKYHEFIPYLIKMNQEQQNEISSLKSQLSTNQNEINSLESQLSSVFDILIKNNIC
jgi:hypothetical protein